MSKKTTLVTIERGKYSPLLQLTRARLSAISAHLQMGSTTAALNEVNVAISNLHQIRSGLESK